LFEPIAKKGQSENKPGVRKTQKEVAEYQQTFLAEFLHKAESHIETEAQMERMRQKLGKYSQNQIAQASAIKSGQPRPPAKSQAMRAPGERLEYEEP